MMADDLRGRRPFGLEDDLGIVVPEDAPAVETAPLSVPTTPAEWIRQNLFSSWFNSILTVVFGIFVLFALYNVINFTFASADWEVVRRFMRGYMVGRFPIEEVWRIWVCAYAVATLAGLSLGMSGWLPQLRRRRVPVIVIAAGMAILIMLYTTETALVRVLIAGIVAAIAAGVLLGRVSGSRLRRPLITAWLLLFPAMLFVVRGFDGVTPRLWGGLFFNLIAATVGIVMSFPIGILLALGRRSDLPAVRLVCVVIIEVFRGVPLIAWLFFSKFVVDLLLPPQVNIPDIIKAFVAMTMFSSAYVGEIVRGGLQGVHHGQYEAGRALGLSPARLTVLVVMPQALRSTIPPMIGHFISLFKDTSLFVAINVTDLLAATRRSASSLDFLGRDAEVLLFAAMIFWVIAFSMSRWSQRLELRLGVGER
jgi:general L-amino acid transport system permease protein